MSGAHPQTTSWKGNEIRVTARLEPRFLWSTASIDVFAGGDCILQTSGQMKVAGSCTADFSRDGTVHRAELTWRCGLLCSFPYQLRMDGLLISDSRVKISNWPIGLLVPSVLAIVFLGLFIFWVYAR
jgi:hypothetical protein